MDPLVSIIIPTYNRAHLIGETLDSVIAQTYSNWECIVVDDGSVDHTDELMEFYCKKDSRIHYEHRPKDRPKGANACRNYGFELSKGNLIQWLDSDDLLMPTSTQKKATPLIDGRYNLSVCNISNFRLHKSNTVRIVRNYTENSYFLIKYLTGKIHLQTSSVLWRREIVQDFRFDTNLSRAQELDFYFRVLEDSKVDAFFIDETLVQIRTHENSMTGAYQKGELNSILSELKVRRRTMAYVFKFSDTAEEKISSLDIYLLGFRRLYRTNSIVFVFRELREIEGMFPLKESFKKWKYFLLVSLLFYKMTGREFRLKGHLFGLKNHLRL